MARYALLVATGTTINQRDAAQLRGPQSDVVLFALLLIARYGISPENILIVGLRKDQQPGDELCRIPSLAKRVMPCANSSASYSEIDHGFAWLRSKALKKGDQALVFYSGHGANIDNPGGDEIDNLDQAWVPYDYSSTPEGQKRLIRDDTVWEWLQPIRKAKAHITAVADCCFAAGSFKSINTVNRPTAFASEGDKSLWSEAKGERKDIRIGDRRPPVFIESPAMGVSQSITDMKRAGCSIIAACRRDQMAGSYYWDQKLCFGVFTLALCRILMDSPHETEDSQKLQRLLGETLRQFNFTPQVQQPMAFGHLTFFNEGITDKIPTFGLIQPYGRLITDPIKGSRLAHVSARVSARGQNPGGFISYI